ncbi:MAG: DinB family protein [Candidatus Hydrogenedentes bacterium]|nr:DinB family protein [Candidatus Hydrogenedentota bacterium]
MFDTINSFLYDWKEESGRTAKIFDALSDASLAQRVAEGHWSLGQIAWHLVTAIPEMMGHTGLTVDGPGPDAPVPAAAAEIAAAYKAVAAALADRVEAEWTDDTLKVVDEMYGLSWPRGVTLRVLLRHEIHHRAQMTVLMRQAGLTVPGIYGPAKEDWAKMGKEPPEH